MLGEEGSRGTTVYRIMYGEQESETETEEETQAVIRPVLDSAKGQEPQTKKTGE